MEGIASSSKSMKTGKRKSQRSRSRRRKAREEVMFRNLEVKLDLSEKQIGVKYKKFLKNHPTGEMSKQEFMEATKKMGTMKRSMAESLFRVFDEDDSGSMDFEEFMMASNCSNMASPEDKLEWIFKVFDEDGGGFIDVDEVIKLVIGLFKMSGGIEDKEVILACVLDIFNIIDVDGDGEITRDEFVNNAMKSGFIQNVLDEKDDTDDETEEEAVDMKDNQVEEIEIDENKDDIIKEIKKMREEKLEASKLHESDLN